MKSKLLITIFLISCIFNLASNTKAYIFWLKSSDNTIENIQEIENKYQIRLPVVWFIFDPRWNHILDTINNLWSWLGYDRVYHITVSPNNFSAQEVIEWIFDKEYQSVFKAIKNNDIKVIFRTMHEMNWWRYPRASNPELFKQAWIHVWKLSRKEWLNQFNILFDFSINHRDMPTNQTPSQSAKLIQCSPSQKEKLNCYTFEDYYPWDNYVDIVWVSFYNRWKATSNRLRIAPEEIINDTSRNTLSRMEKLWKPLFIDEVATTSVYYTSAYDAQKSKEIYNTQTERKNQRLKQLKDFMLKHHQIYWALYFNTDYTDWLHFPQLWEADRSIINLYRDKFYQWFWDIYNISNNNFYKSNTPRLFNTYVFTKDSKTILVPYTYKDSFKKILEFTEKSQDLKFKLLKINPDLFKDKKLKTIISKIQEFYN